MLSRGGCGCSNLQGHLIHSVRKETWPVHWSCVISTTSLIHYSNMGWLSWIQSQGDKTVGLYYHYTCVLDIFISFTCHICSTQCICAQTDRSGKNGITVGKDEIPLSLLIFIYHTIVNEKIKYELYVHCLSLTLLLYDMCSFICTLFILNLLN